MDLNKAPGQGGAGVFGANLTIANSGSISGGMSGDGNSQADAITFTGGSNYLALGAKAAFTGAINIKTGTLTFDQSKGSNLSADVALSASITGAGSVVKDGTGTLTLSGASSYTGATTITNGTLALTAPSAAGRGTIDFDADTNGFATLKLTSGAQPANGATFSNTLTDFGIGDALDLAGLAFTPVSSASVALNVLTVISGGRAESFVLQGSREDRYGIADDGNGGTLVGTETTGQITSSAGDTYTPTGAQDVPLIVYGGIGLAYTVTTATVNGHQQLKVSNGFVTQLKDLDASQHGLSFDFSDNKVAVSLSGGTYGDSLRSGSANDMLTGGGGNDTLDGMAGTDTAIYAGARSDYIVKHLGDGGVSITDNRTGASVNEGTDTVRDVEFFTFGATTLTYAQLNDAPTMTGAGAVLSTKEDTSRTISTAELVQGYTDKNSDELSVTDLKADGGTIIDNQNGTYTFKPDANFNGTVGLTYNVSDGYGGTTAATQTITVTAVNDAPTATALTQSLRLAEDGPADKLFTQAVGVADIDSASVTATLTLSNPAAGVLTGATATATPGVYTITGTPAQVQTALNAVTFDSADNFNGNASVTVAISDGNPAGTTGTQPSGIVSITVSAVNDLPTLTGAKATLPAGSEDKAYTVTAATLLKGYTDADGDTLTVVGLKANQGSVSLRNGTYTITPDKNYNGPVTLSYGVSDGTTTTAAMQSFNLAPVNDAPTASDDTAAVLTGAAVSGNLVTDKPADSDPDGDALSVSQVGFAGANKAVGAAGTSLDGAHGTLTLKADGTYSYAAEAGGGIPVGDSVTDSFTYTVSDGHGGTDTAVLTVTVTGSDTGTSGNDTFLLTGSGTKATGLGGNDTYLVDQSTDQVVEAPNGGVDLVKSFASYVLPDNVENLTLYGTANLNGTGNALNNTIRGNSGNNVLAGKLGNDTLIGSGGHDTFVFDTAPGPRNVDHIEGFSVTDDTIALDNAVYKGLVNGPLLEGQFKDITHGAKLDAGDRILYDHDTGRLFYDADGSGSGARVQFAILDQHPTLTFQDFHVV